jgi:hypothetical protein
MNLNNKYINLLEQIITNAEPDRINGNLYHLKISSELILSFVDQINSAKVAPKGPKGRLVKEANFSL